MLREGVDSPSIRLSEEESMARSQAGKRSGQKKLAGKAMKKVRGGGITVNTNVNSVMAQRQSGRTSKAIS